MARKILIAEDSKLSRKLLADILSREYEVLEAVNGEEAVALLDRHARSISAFVLDLMMPVMDGYEVLEKMRENAAWSQIPVIVATGDEDDEAELKALSLGANEFVAKPYKPALIREGFFWRAAELLENHESGYYIMASFDIENFKVINDQYGNDKGDDLLKRTAEIIKSFVEPLAGICCRLAADNFAALYPRAFSGSEQSFEMRRRLVAGDGSIPRLTYSVGLYAADDLSVEVSSMYDRAAIAKLSVKGRYDKHIAHYDSSMRERIINEQKLVDRMHAALEQKQFEAWFQPQFNHATGALIGAEALVRWRSPDNGIIPPGEFIPVFERNGFVYELDKFVWEQACSLLRKWIDAGHSPLPVSVNISRQDVFREDFFEVITGLVAKYNIPVELLRLEITESAFSEYPEQIVAIVKQLMDFGFEVEIDDFGSGYSSLNTLKDVPASVLKLDMKFLESSSDSQRGGNILQSIVRMSKWLGMAVIAEGVETKEQADYLQSIGCSYVQGYYYARPMPAHEYEKLVAGGLKGERLLSLETVENLDNNAFWDPKSMDTLIFNSYVGGACIFEYHDGEIELLRVNNKYVQELGSAMSSEEIYSFKLADCMDEANMDILLENIRRAIKTNSESVCETRVAGLYGNAEPVYVRATVRVIAQAGSRYLLYCSVINMTQQRIAEQKERELSERITAIMGNIDGGVTAVVQEGDKPRFLFANEQFYRMLGYTCEQFESEVSGAFDRIHPDDRARVASESIEASRQLRPFSTTYRVLSRDGSVRWMRSNISITSFPGESEPVQLAVATDVTEEQENSLKMNELLNAIPGGVVIYRVGESVETLYSSDGMAKLSGISEEEYNAWIEGDLVSAAVYNDDVAMVREQLMAAVASDSPINLTFRLKHKSGGMVWVEFSATKISEDNKGKIYYGVFTKPATEAALYQNLVTDSTTATIIMEKNGRKILYANPEWRRIEGVSETAVISGVRLTKFIPKDKLYFTDEDVRALPYERYSEFHKTSNTGRKVTLNARSLVWNGVDAYVCYLTDETALWNSHQELQGLIDRVPVGIGICEISAGRLSLTYTNEAYYRMLGYTREERAAYLGENALHAVFEEDMPAIAEGIRKIERGTDAMDVMFRTFNSKNEQFWIRIQASVIERKKGVVTVYCALTDFDSVMRSRSELESSRAMLDEALRRAKVMGWRYDYRTRTITDTGSIGQVYKLPPIIENLPESMIEAGFIANESEQDLRELFREAALEKPATREVKIKVGKDAKYTWVRLIYTPVFDKKGRYLETIGTSIDITEQVERERKYEEQLKLKKVLSNNEVAVALLNLTKNTVSDVECVQEIRQYLTSDTVDDMIMAVGLLIENEKHRAEYIASFDRRAMLERYQRGELRGSVRHRSSRSQSWYESVYELLKNPYTGDVEMLAVLRDITSIVRAEQVVETLMRIDYESILTIDVASGEPRPIVNGNISEVMREQNRVGDNVAGVESYLRARCIDDDVERIIEETSMPFVKQRLKTAPFHAVSYTVELDDGSAVRKRVVYAYLNEHKDTLLCAMQKMS